MNQRIDPEHLLTAVDEILSLLAVCRQAEPLPQLIQHLELITPRSDARAAARMTARSLPPPNNTFELPLTRWWLDNLSKDSACPPHLALYEILGALEIGRAPPSTRTQLHTALRDTLDHSLSQMPEAATLLLLLPDMVKRPALLPDTRLTVFNTVIHHSEQLLRDHPHVTRQQIHLLAQAAHTSWKPAALHATPASPSEAMQIITLADCNTEEAALRAHLLLQDTDGTPARQALLDQMSLDAARTLPPHKLIHFMAGLHSHILFMPELAQPSRSLLIDAFDAAAHTPNDRCQLAEKIRPQLFADGPLNIFLLNVITEGPKPPATTSPAAAPSLLGRAKGWIRRHLS